MINFPENLILRMMRSQLSGWYKGPITVQRARQERSARFFPLPKHIRCQEISVDGVPSEWIESPGTNIGTILYFHGGAYALGSVNTHRELVARLVISTKCSALAINYRLAPENPFPAALEDALKAYHWLQSTGIDPSRIYLAGDSAGGGLAIATLISLRDQGEPLPAGAFCFSPWLDLTLSGSTIRKHEYLDPMLKQSILEVYASYYIGNDKATNPYISPLHADLRGLPPIHLQSGGNEILLDDSIRFCDKARQDSVDITLSVWDDMFHVFQLIPFLPQSDDALTQVACFVSRIAQEQE